MDPRIEALSATYGDAKWINSFVSKGPIVIEWMDRPHWIVADEKTEGYPFTKWVGMNILTGGNWREFRDGTIATSPLWLYKRQLKEELVSNWPGKLVPVVTPFSTYLEIDRVEDHGREEMRTIIPETNGTVYAIVTVIGSRIEGEELQEELKVASKDLSPQYLLGRIRSSDVGQGKKPGLTVFTFDDLRGGAIDNFAAGDGEKLRDYLEEEYEVRLPHAPRNGRSFRLTEHGYSPTTHYAEMTELLPYLRTNPLAGRTAPQSPFR